MTLLDEIIDTINDAAWGRGADLVAADILALIDRAVAAERERSAKVLRNARHALEFTVGVMECVDGENDCRRGIDAAEAAILLINDALAAAPAAPVVAPAAAEGGSSDE